MSDIFQTVNRVGKRHGQQPIPDYGWDPQDLPESYNQIDQHVARRMQLSEEQRRRKRRANIFWACVFYALIACVVWLACHEIGIGPL